MTTDSPKTASTKGTSASNLAKKTAALKLDDQQTSTASPTQPKAKAKLVDVSKLWAKDRNKRKRSAAFVVLGHVDHGKSTLMGRLLLDTGAVAQRDIDKYGTSPPTSPICLF